MNDDSCKYFVACGEWLREEMSSHEGPTDARPGHCCTAGAAVAAGCGATLLLVSIPCSGTPQCDTPRLRTRTDNGIFEREVPGTQALLARNSGWPGRGQLQRMIDGDRSHVYCSKTACIHVCHRPVAMARVPRAAQTIPGGAVCGGRNERQPDQSSQTSPDRVQRAGFGPAHII
jgi:hypothetical protein